MNKTAKWKMNRAGLLNFWYYDNEIFDFADGKLLLRGSNGSGKSVTMQSLLPVLLDGRKSPDRLDPFGSKARRMEDYLLGEKDIVDRDERTGYLFLEYKLAETGQYITTGIGMQARRHKPMNAWYFVITDNRRVGYSIDLHETERHAGESQDVPLSRTQLENRIGDGGKVVRTAGEYKKLVNKYIFGFENIEAYDDLIKLLIQLRSPKLSKEFRPTAIYDILEAALPPITDDDLRHLSDTIEHMDQTKQQIEQLEREQTAVEKLIHRYHAYNEYRLAESAQHLKRAESQYHKEGQTLKEKRQGITELQTDVQTMTDRATQLDQQKDVLEQKRERLQHHKVWRMEKELYDERAVLETVQKDLEKRDQALTSKKRQELDVKEMKEDLEMSVEAGSANLSDRLVDMQADAEDASFDGHDVNEADFNRHKETAHDFSVWLKETDAHFQKLDAISEELQVYEQLKSELTKLDKQVAETRQELDQTKQEEQDWLAIFEKDKQAQLHSIYQWTEDHAFLSIPEDVLQQTSRNMYSLYEPVSYEQVRTPFVKVSNAYQMKINESIATKNSRIKLLEETIEEKEAEHAEWVAKKDPEPPFQQATTKHARAELKANGQRFVPLYEAVEFQDHVTADVRRHIESALIDTGLLDALIADEKLTITHDRIIQPAPHIMAHTLADYLVPDEGIDTIIPAEKVDDILRSILVDPDGTETTAINVDGTYQIGLTTGHAVSVEEVRFIGKKARERYRQTQIEAIRTEIAALKQEQETINHAIKTLETDIANAEKALESFPDDEDLHVAFSHVQEKRFHINQLDKRLQGLNNDLHQAHQTFQETKSKLGRSTRDLNIEFSRHAYLQAKEIMRRYEKDLQQLITVYTTYQHHQANLAKTNGRLEELASEVIELQGDLNDLHDRKARTEQNIREIEHQLDMADADTIREEIRTVQQQLSATVAEQDEIKTKLPQKKVDQTRLEEEAADKEQAQTFWGHMIEAWSNTFHREVDFGFIPVPDELETRGEQLNWILTTYESVLNDKDMAKIEEQLTKVFYEQQSNLMEYRMIDTTDAVRFSEFEWLTDEWTEAQTIQLEHWKQKATRRLIQLDFQGRRVNPYYMGDKLERDRLQQQTMLDDQDRQLYEDILFDSVGRKLRSRINRAEKWTKDMDKLMQNTDSSSGLTFSIKWKPRTAETETELDTKELVDLLRRNPRLLKEADIERVSDHFRSKIDRAKELVDLEGEGNTLLQVLKEVLDYRNWFSFVLSYERIGENKRELTNHAFYQFSGGEKAMAMYIPLFTACYSRYREADETAPYIISLDEAFAGVDENNIREMFEIVEQLGFDYIMNSQVLWGIMIRFLTWPFVSLCDREMPHSSQSSVIIGTVKTNIWSSLKATKKRELKP
ncbi:hypothetical protein JNUCC1_02898 [Lentibacillus sp. JNUCC-1]|uniref:TIGR02680 family protein n=1 Tax=Lentibacillus sp. JNUCC-1 TaxID=2654513 RepID=UPI0012E87935|nr:TIGR02680 family protein [Lentibacillus sp. JNUCC-1]MUV39026.1 hypothetical protein [Lentibacillus sp. JNUCC-1]